MTTPALAAEAEQASVAFQLALVRIGVGTIEEAMALWASVNPTKVEATAGRWLDQAVQMIVSRRAISRDLAFAYYRLARALRTGTTIADPYHPLRTHPTLTDVRHEFASMVDDVARVHGPVPAQPVNPVVDKLPDEQTPQAVTPDQAIDDEADRLLVEELKGLVAEEARLEAAAEEEARVVLAALGPVNLESKLSDMDSEMTASEMDAAREAAHKEAGVRQAAAAERIVLNGGRGALWSYAERDKRAKGYVRVSKTGTPCGFCAMLISRGVTYYSSKDSAEFRKSDGDLYHDNCHCYAEPVFSSQQYQGALFALNRKYELDWPVVTKGLGGKDALNAWRRHINQELGRTFQIK